jgi:glycosyltransferase involved in cell wall biosynthesis
LFDSNFLLPINQLTDQPLLLYQGAVNEGRSFETLRPAMKMVDARLVIAGEGNFFEEAKAIAREEGLGEKVLFTGYLSPEQLKQLTPQAYAGITIFENTGLNQYYSLANRYFDYIQAGIPQLCVNYPEYNALNQQFETALLTDDISPEGLARQLNLLLSDTVLYERLKTNTIPAGKAFCCEEEEKRLLTYWKAIIPPNQTIS